MYPLTNGERGEGDPFFGMDVGVAGWLVVGVVWLMMICRHLNGVHKQFGKQSSRQASKQASNRHQPSHRFRHASSRV